MTRVLSIQSHVVSGYVGNKCSTITLQCLGIITDSINTVQFSNHTGYSSFSGRIGQPNELLELCQGLNNNKLNNYDAILSGYVHSSEYLKTLHETIHETRKNGIKFIYVCDPVLGDEGKLYVDSSLIDVYKNNLIPIANIITPNQFEAELLTNMKIKNESDVIICIQKLHSLGPKIVVITSVKFDKYRFYASQKEDDQFQIYSCDLDYVDLRFVGSGDLLSALLLGWYLRLNGDLKKTISISLSTMQTILKDTKNHFDTSKSKRI
ncbi:hypothetical protein A3Q56_01097 [Intoshia linei]|uniref:Pyridoxal kinase n=1 Tax=Intoshia linei TaxID=1819745 RepID=A0A177BAD6_9BILA|nr:hypothetical protein A3Q56_01097 [Intoshia linei]